MKENTLNKLFVACVVLIVLGCHARKQIMGTNATAPADHVSVRENNLMAAKLDPIRTHQIAFNTFAGKARTSLNINGNSNDCTLNIRINRDKKIWVSVTALLGIEVARAVITPDSIMIVNRLQGIYVKKPFSYVYAYTNKQINYSMLQALLVGNVIPSLLNDSTKYQSANNTITLSGNLQDIMYSLMVGNDMRVTQTNLSNQNQGVSLQVSNNNFIQSGTQKVPSQIDIASVARDKKIQVNMHYVKVDLNQPQDYPFSIPSSYTRQD